MKTVFIQMVVFLTGFQSFSNEEVQIDSLLTAYANSIIQYSANENSKAAYRSLNHVFSSLHDDHENDLFGNEIKCEILTYLRYIKDNFNHNLKVSISDQKILKCVKYVDGEKKYRFATFTKTTKYERKTASIPYLMVIDISLPRFKISGVYIRLGDTEKAFFDQCPPDEIGSNTLTQTSQQKLLGLHLSNAKNALASKDYMKANKLYTEALRIDSTSIRASRGIRQTGALITTKDKKKYISNLLEDKKFNAALKALSQTQLDGVRFNPKWVNTIKLKCKRGNMKLESDHYKQEGDALYKIGRYEEARNWYQKFMDINPGRTDIMVRIELSKTKDPVYAQKELDKAYLQALESTDTHIGTFYTYLRYGDTGYLRGDQYDFMVRMLLSRRSKIKRQLSYSKDEMDELIKKYYFLTKERGYRNSDLKNLIPNYLTDEKY